MYSKILVPIDGSDTAALGLAEAMRLARLSGGSIQLLNVIDTLALAMSLGGAYVHTQEVIDQLKQGGQDVLAHARATVEAAGVPVETELHDAMTQRVSDVVVDQARSWGAEIIVIGTHGRRGVRRALLGSDAEQIVRLAPMPVMLVHGPGEAPAG